MTPKRRQSAEPLEFKIVQRGCMLGDRKLPQPSLLQLCRHHGGAHPARATHFHTCLPRATRTVTGNQPRDESEWGKPWKREAADNRKLQHARLWAIWGDKEGTAIVLVRKRTKRMWHYGNQERRRAEEEGLG